VCRRVRRDNADHLAGHIVVHMVHRGSHPLTPRHTAPQTPARGEHGVRERRPNLPRSVSVSVREPLGRSGLPVRRSERV
jgi:hypothetical protein